MSSVLAVLQVFLDESGIHGGAQMCVIAGFIGSETQWSLFRERYVRGSPHALSPGLHAKKFFARHDRKRVPPYADLSDAEATQLIASLTEAVATTDVWPILAALEVNTFREYSLEERKRLTGHRRVANGPIPISGAPSKPYYVVFQSALVQAVQHVKRPDLRVRFLFDEQNVLAPFALQLYAYVKRARLWGLPPERLEEAAFGNRVQNPALQAADLLAYCWYQLHVCGSRAALPPDVRHPLDTWANTKGNGELSGEFLNKRTMDHLLGKVPLAESKTYTLA